ncbi:HAD family hydrolase [Pelagivirga sediminicola]|uniref:HAD family hydrolase n=1 Tax=Pelagivirga sediminicola TaxID=2170575 RepID=A0A2T7G6X6_9RHOB|nr:HAD-IA family hydrolase [Pelagivirga sediminicola]PVA10169.1 HAD family hydrolase [Pelagivirga sediminicola]
MTAPLRLIIFDVDGTLVDSQGDIVASMHHAFDEFGVPVPERAAIIGIIGLSLPVAMARLAPELDSAAHDALVDGYKRSYLSLRAKAGAAQSSPLFPGTRDMLEALSARDDLLLGVATGKSRRGLDKLLEGHGLQTMFVTQQVADFHPSKPHPAMIHAALAEAGVDAGDAVMIGDTTYDMDMARAAGIGTIGVEWGYHPAADLRADHLLSDWTDLPARLSAIWEKAQ